MNSVLRVCPAKVNLLLKILNKRPDGFHELITLMHPLELHDQIEIWKKSTSGIELTCQAPEVPTDQKNLMVRAAEKYLEVSGITLGIGMRLEKKIPTAAGMGGGSSDAAHTLLGLNELFDNALTISQLHNIAAQLGSDINFFLTDEAALCRGRGERVEPLGVSAGWGVVLVHPGLPLSAKEVYQVFQLPTTSLLTDLEEKIKIAVTSLKNNDLSQLNKVLVNDLEGAAIKKLPELSNALDVLRDSGFQKPLISGSGPTLFALSQSLSDIDDKIETLRRCLPKQYTVWASRLRRGDKL